MRFHKIANVNKALEFISSKGVKLVSIGAEGMSISPISGHIIPEEKVSSERRGHSVRWLHVDCHACFAFRDCGWKCENDSGNDLDNHPTLRHSGHLSRR